MISRSDRSLPSASSDARAAGGASRLAERVVIVGFVGVGTIVGGLSLARILDHMRGGEVIELRGVDVAGVAQERDAWERAVTGAIDPVRIARDIAWLASPERGGRDTPSVGLRAAQEYVAERFAAAGLETVTGSGTYFHEYEADTIAFGRVPITRPDPGGCRLRLPGVEGGSVLGEDFVPLSAVGYQGIAEGELVYCGFGIENEDAGWDDFATVEVEGRIAIVLSGEPEVGEALAGEEASAEASVWNKIDELAKRGAAGALVVQGRVEVESGDAGGGVARRFVSAPLGYRVTRATWSPPSFDEVRGGIPTLEITRDLAARILGAEPDGLERLEPATSAAFAPDRAGRARLEASIERASVQLRNVVGLQWGTGADSGAGTVLIGAHLDHIGEGPRGRVARGADDNASGVAALLALAESFARSPPRVNVLFACFSGEEDGLLGSRALARDLDVIAPPRPVQLMVNMDMIGRGPTSGVAVLRDAPRGAEREKLDAWLVRAAHSNAHRLTSVRRVDGASGFFERSDQMSFLEVGVPAMFVFEDWPHRPGGLYHTWRDTPEFVDAEKVARTAGFVGVLVGVAGGGT